MVVLDHGYVKIAEPVEENIWGSDASIIRAARMSTNKGFRGWGDGAQPGDEKLLRYLYTHKHMTPFEMAGMIVEVQAPIMVFREWHRHRTQSYNEMSGRYTELPDLYYIPSLNRIENGAQDWVNKQSSGAGLHPRAAVLLQKRMEESVITSRREYERLLRDGLSRELARLVLPVTQYSRMRASANLRNWLAFLELRQAAGTQFEIREYANAVATLIEQQFPRTYALFKETPDGN